MFPVFRLIELAVRGIISLTTSSEASDTYKPGQASGDKEFYDEHYPFQFNKRLLNGLPNEIEYYEKNIGHVTLFRKNEPKKFFEIYETGVISDKELVMNVRLSYEDFVMTGISSQRNTIITQNQVFVLVINDKLNRLEINSSLQHNLTDKNVKRDFGDYLFSYLEKQGEERVSV
ncbi:hypothetical protein [Mucilaginibacter sp.]|uniref:hypothetical protein n=1 Tax=Mucilaginibacter sp. TaxID=1882438 RepID=UPI002601A423|nr:hypothetical protein [Mucilaginibacter sp.]MDB5130006.1 hypothetical protein [Mucilaginibacter sp.]